MVAVLSTLETPPFKLLRTPVNLARVRSYYLELMLLSFSLVLRKVDMYIYVKSRQCRKKLFSMNRAGKGLGIPFP